MKCNEFCYSRDTRLRLSGKWAGMLLSGASICAGSDINSAVFLLLTIRILLFFLKTFS